MNVYGEQSDALVEANNVATNEAADVGNQARGKTMIEEKNATDAMNKATDAKDESYDQDVNCNYEAQVAIHA